MEQVFFYDHAAADTHTAIPGYLRCVAAHDVLIGRHTDNKDRKATVVRVEGSRAQIRHDGGRLSWISASTLYDRYLLESDPTVRLTIGDEDPTDRRNRTGDHSSTPTGNAAAKEEPATHSRPRAEDEEGEPVSTVTEGVALTVKEEPATHSRPRAEDEEGEPVSTVTEGVALTVVNGWDIYTHKATREPTVRDLDMAERAGLAAPRNIRSVIRLLVEDGEAQLIPEGMNSAREECAVLSPRVYAVSVETKFGNGAVMPVVEYHLNELASLLLVFRLQTEKAKALRLDVAKTFLLVRDGRYEEAAQVATGQAANVNGVPMSLQMQIDTIKSLVDQGVISAKTGAVQQALLVGQATGFDFTRAQSVVFEEWNSITETVSTMNEGESFTVQKNVDITGHLTASQLGQECFPTLSPQRVHDFAKAMGIHGLDVYGKSAPVMVNGRHRNNAWYYNQAAQELLRPALQVLTTRIANRGRTQIQDVIEQVAKSFAPSSD